ncbi:phage minor head protein, partial [Treponema pedis]|uniref:phage minor head protein n=1 Tax=Treponema pedis TaxID=409322 RepID=UPI003D1DC576
ETWEDVKAIAEKNGSSFSPGYWETVYRTNTQSAYNAGRLMQYQNNPPPAWELLFIEDGRQSDICKGIAALVGNGKALPSNHNFWSTYGFPPYHFNCRTTFRAVYDYETKHGTEIVNTPMEQIRQNFKPQKGFGGNPIEKESWWKITPEMIARADKYGITADIVAQAGELDMQSYFPELLQNYKTMYKGENGGYVQMALNAEHNDNEIASAKRLAELGHKVYLLPRTYKSSSPDMIIDNEIGEIKRLGFDIKKSTTIETMKTEIKKAGQKQRSRVLYLEVADTINEEDIFKAIKSEIGRTPIKTVLIDYKGIVKTYTRSFFRPKK